MKFRSLPLVLAGILCCFTIASARADEASLKGITSFLVQVNITCDNSITAAGLSEDNIKSDVELALQNAGIRTVTREIWNDDPNSAILEVTVVAVPITLGNQRTGFAFSHSVGVYQQVKIKQGPDQWSGGAVTHKDLGVQVGAPDSSTVRIERDTVVDMVRKIAAVVNRLKK